MPFLLLLVEFKSLILEEAVNARPSALSTSFLNPLLKVLQLNLVVLDLQLFESLFVFLAHVISITTHHPQGITILVGLVPQGDVPISQTTSSLRETFVTRFRILLVLPLFPIFESSEIAFS